MSGQSEHPARLLLDSNFTPGLLTKIVLHEHEQDPAMLVDSGALRAGFEKLKCTHTLRMIDLLELSNASGRKLLQMGSGSIDLEQCLAEEFSFEKAMRLQELYLGIPRLKILPLAWLAYLLRGIEAVPADLLRAFDMVLGGLVDWEEAAASATPMTHFEEHFEQKSVDQILREITKPAN